VTVLTFRDSLDKLAPPWLRTFWSSRLLYSFGVNVDALITCVELGVKARFPEYAPSDALSYLGRERQIRRGFAESDASYAQRLTQWIDDRRERGGPQATMRQLQGYFTGHEVPTRIVNPQGAWHTLSYQGVPAYYRKTPTNWDWDGVTASWSRYWIILYIPATLATTDGDWGDAGTWGDGGTWGTTLTVEQAESIRAIAKEWNPPHASCPWIILAFDQGSFQPVGSGAGFPAGNWTNWGALNGGNYEAVRLDTARYMTGY